MRLFCGKAVLAVLLRVGGRPCLISEKVFLYPLLRPPGHTHPVSRIFILKQIRSHLSSLETRLWLPIAILILSKLIMTFKA